jgi:alpha-1,3-rhamnosyl/mannosyltransferase
VFLSEYEGFGLTPLEALAAGVPIVVLDTAVAREVYGDAAIYVARPDPVLVADALTRAVADPDRGRVLTAAESTLSRYSWTRCAERTLAVLVESGAPTR